MDTQLRGRAGNRSHGTLISFAAVAIAMAAGCSGNPPTSAHAPSGLLVVSPPAVSATPALDTVRGLTLPIQAYKPVAAQQNVITDAEEKLVAHCMSQFGFTWTYSPSNVSDYNEVDREYGVADLATAQKYGYHLPPADGGGASAGSHSGQATGAPLSPSEVLVLSGSTTGADSATSPGSYQGRQIPRGGCSGQARRQVTVVDEIDPTSLVDSIGLGMWKKAQSDARVVAGFRAWSACMRQAGYDYPTPLAAVGDRRWARPAVSQAEIQTAVADVRCKQRTKLIGIWFSVESGYEKEAIQQNIQQLTQIRNRWAAAARKAAQILGVSAPHS